MTYDQTKTIDLVYRAQRGEKEAIDRILDRYYERVRRIVSIRLGPQLRNALDSSDILQETFLTAAKRFQDFEPRDEASLINWLSKLAEHKITDAAGYLGASKRDSRRSVSLSAHSTDSSHGPLIDPADDGPSPSTQVATSEEAEIVESCVHELPDSYRELILLRNYAGTSWAAIAEETGRPSEAAARMMHGKAMFELTKLMKRRMRA